MVEIMDTLFRVAQGITALVTLLMICVKPFRSWFLNLQDRKKQESIKDENRDEALRCSLRDIITRFYYSHLHCDGIHQYEYENIYKVYKAYKRMNGNSFVDKIWEEIQEWEIIP